MKVPVVYTLPTCPACTKLKEDWTADGVQFKERQVNESQETLDEALKYGDMVPIIVFPDGKIEVGYKNMIG